MEAMSTAVVPTESQRITACRACGHGIAAFMTLGRQPIAQAFSKPPVLSDDRVYELAPAICEGCGLFQLMETPPPFRLFHSEYPYLTSQSAVVRNHLHNWGEELIRTLQSPDSFVVEIGSNDGTFLEVFLRSRIRHLGVDPAAGPTTVARNRGASVIQDWFSQDTAKRIATDYGRADLVVASNAIAHISTIESVGQGVLRLLKPSGLFVFEAIYLPNVIRSTAYDQLYDEHVFTFSVTAIHCICKMWGLRLLDVLPLPTQGGSMRYTVGHQSRTSSSRVSEWLELEAAEGIVKPITFEEFAKRSQIKRNALRHVLQELRSRGNKIAGYGATAKSTTLLNYSDVDASLIEYVVDSTPSKQGCVTPGTRIPICAPEYFSIDTPDVTVLLAWNHRAEIEGKVPWYRANGGRWIVHVPEVAVI